jgi:hypothetical protein
VAVSNLERCPHRSAHFPFLRLPRPEPNQRHLLAARGEMGEMERDGGRGMVKRERVCV